MVEKRADVSPREMGEAAIRVAGEGVRKAPVAWAIAFTVCGCAALVLGGYFLLVDRAAVASAERDARDAKAAVEKALPRSEFEVWVKRQHKPTADALAAIKDSTAAIRTQVSEGRAIQGAQGKALDELHKDVREIRSTLRDK